MNNQYIFWRLLVAAISLILAMATVSAQATVNTLRILIVADSVVMESKFELLRAAADGVEVEVLRSGSVDAEALAQAMRVANWVFADVPREQHSPAVSMILQEASQLLVDPPPTIIVGRTTGSWHGVEGSVGDRLWQYFRHAGAANMQLLVATLRAIESGENPLLIEAPRVLPLQGAYHPSFPGLVSDTPVSILAATAHPDSRGRVGIGFHPSFIESNELAHVDALVAALADKSISAVPLFYSMGTDLDLVGLTAGLDLDALIHLSPVYHLGLRQQLEQLDIPVLQGIGWSEGSAEHFRQSATGLSLTSTPIYLALPEQAGLVDPVVLFARGQGSVEVIPEQVRLVAEKAAAYVDLRRAERDRKRLAVMVYNYPSGERNVAASFLNVPRSLAVLSEGLAEYGFATDGRGEDFWIQSLGRMMRGLHQPQELFDAVEGEVARLPLGAYLTWYQQLSPATRERIEARWGTPQSSPYFKDGAFHIPIVQVGNLVVLPQPPRGAPGQDNERALYHDMRLPVNHHYLAVYLWVRDQLQAHALMHFGTHGTQEWMPGKERGLHAEDDSLLALGSIPVIYPYIIDNVGEATQAKRRGRAVIISHQTPPFRAAGLYGELIDMHNLVHQWETLEAGELRNNTLYQLRDSVLASEALVDFPWDAESILADPDGFVIALHDELHDLADSAQPIGLHTFGKTPESFARITTILQMLGPDFLQSLDLEDADEVYTDDHANLDQSAVYLWLESVLSGDPQLPKEQQRWAELARLYAANLDATGEFASVLKALGGRHVSTGIAGDPIRVPDSLPSGRNLYGFDPSALPTRAAWLTGKAIMADLLRAHEEARGEPLRKVAYSLWAVEAMRHGGMLESQALYAMGLEPVWNERGRITGVRVIPREELGRPRVDVVLSATGLYRDQFPNLMALLAQGAAQIADLDELDNPSYANTRRLLDDLLSRGVEGSEAEYLSKVRLFGSPTGVYGTGLEDAAMASDTWDSDEKLARLYLRRMSYAFGPDTARWGRGEDTSALYAANLNGVEAAILARTSNLYGMLTTDDPFQYLGGLSLAIRHVSGSSPELYIANQRQPGRERIESAARFLAQELQTRAFHPGWIQSMQAEGYSGALSLQDMTANLWGWQVTDPNMVTAAQWQRLHSVYVNDALNLGMQEWFREHHPESLLRMVERMLEATRKEYWEPTETTLRELVETWVELTEEFMLSAGNPAIATFVQGTAAGFGLNGMATEFAEAAVNSAPPPEGAASEVQSPTSALVSGRELVAVGSETPANQRTTYFWLLALVIPVIAGGVRQVLR